MTLGLAIALSVMGHLECEEMGEFDKLLERVKAATGPDRNIDDAVALALCDEHFFAQLADAPEGTGCEMYRFGHHSFHSALRVTDSIDAALALIERLLPDHRFAFYTDGQGKGPCCLVMIGDEPVVAQEFGKTLPLAILAALLVALKSQEQNDGRQ